MISARQLSAIAAGCAALVCGSQARGQAFRFEAENGVRTGVSVATTWPGYSGAGYVTGFDADSDLLAITANVPDGLYELWVGYNSRYGFKGYGVQVGDERTDGSFNGTGNSEYRIDRAGLFDVNAANNTLSIHKGWGYYDIDYFELRPATATPPAPVAAMLSDTLANSSTQHLMNYLTSVYGQKSLAGQQGDDGQNFFPSPTYLNASGGLVPAVRGSDFMRYSPSRRAAPFNENPNNESERLISWARQTGGIVTMSWHWNAPADLVNSSEWPWWSGFRSEATTFNLTTALANPGSPKYNLLLSDIDAIAVELKKFQDKDVPVIWRPLHEAQGQWFWWGEEGPAPFVELWRLMHDRLTDHHGLHNLIWEFTSSPADANHLAWYPGDDVVDIVGLDVYTDKGSSMSGQWLDALDVYDGRKLVALSETGTLPDPELFDEREIRWSYFSPWAADGGDLGVTANYTPQQIQDRLGHEDVITLDELPSMPWNILDVLTADANNDGDVDGADFLTWQRELSSFEQYTADANGDFYVDAADLHILMREFGRIPGVPPAASAVPEPAAALLATMAAALLACGARRDRS